MSKEGKVTIKKINDIQNIRGIENIGQLLGSKKAKQIMTLLNDYKELLSSEECKFSQGYACACAVMLKGHGQDTAVEDTFRANFMSVDTMKKLGVDQYDIDILSPVVKECERKSKLDKKP